MSFNGLQLAGEFGALAGALAPREQAEARRLGQNHICSPGKASFGLPCGPGHKLECWYHDWSGTNDTDAMLANRSSLEQWSNDANAWIRNHCGGDNSTRMWALPIRDEPQWAWGAAPVRTSSIVAGRWRRYLEFNGMTPALLGSDGWSQVAQIGRAEAMAAMQGLSSAAQLQVVRRYYWSLRFNTIDAADYFANGTRALQRATGDSKLTTYTNLFTEPPVLVVVYCCWLNIQWSVLVVVRP